MTVSGEYCQIFECIAYLASVQLKNDCRNNIVAWPENSNLLQRKSIQNQDGNVLDKRRGDQSQTHRNKVNQDP